MKSASIEEIKELSARLRSGDPINEQDRTMLADWLDATAREAEELRIAVQAHLDYVSSTEF